VSQNLISDGRTIWIADAHRDDGKRFFVRADEKLTAFVGVGRGDCGELLRHAGEIVPTSLDMKTRIPPVLITFALVCFALVQNTRAVNPPPDGRYPGFNTAERQNALFSLITGSANTAIGWYSLFGTPSGSFNTAVGAGALDLNTADYNTAVGVAALLLNTTGTNNTANGRVALEFNTTGNFNTASGVEALEHNTIGTDNTANGVDALDNNTTGSGNTALGV